MVVNNGGYVWLCIMVTTQYGHDKLLMIIMIIDDNSQEDKRIYQPNNNGQGRAMKGECL